MNLWRSAWELAHKDLRLFFRDRTAVALSFLLPLGLVSIFGFIMGNVGGGGDALPAIEIAIADFDGTQDSRALLASLVGSELLDVRQAKPEVHWTRDDLQRFVREGDRPVALLIPAGFGAGRAELELFVDPGRAMEKRMVDLALMQALFSSQGADTAWAMSQRALLKAGLPVAWADRISVVTNGFRAGIETLFQQADEAGLLGSGERDEEPVAGAATTTDAAPTATSGSASDGVAAAKPAVDIGSFLQDMLPVTRTAVAPEGREQQLTYQVSHAVSGMTVMMLMFSLVGAARTLIEERDRGTLRRLLSAPIDPRAILLGKLLSSMILGLMLIVVLFAFAAVAFHLDVLSRWDTLLVLAVATALACTGFALAVAAWAKTDKQADGVSTLLILIMAPLGGCWMPLMFLPPAVRTVAPFTLPYWSVVGFQGTFWYGQHWTDPPLLRSIGVLLGIAAALLVLAARLFRTRYRLG